MVDKPVLVVGNPFSLPSRRVFAAWDKEFSPSDRMFKTSIDHIYGKYEERWKEEHHQHEWLLEKAYLTLLLAKSHVDPPTEILFVHCDPLDESYSQPPRLLRVKQGPHLHVRCAEQPIPHCHFPLNCHRLDDVLQSVESFSDAFENIVEAIASEIRVYFSSASENE